MNVGIAGTEKELRAFHFFRTRTIPELCGLFESPFWSRMVLQAVHHEPAVRHAAIALGSFHEMFENEVFPDREKELDSFALRHYLQAVASIVKSLEGKGKHGADVALMTCLLFICVEARFPIPCGIGASQD
jgi:hypothetical protein